MRIPLSVVYFVVGRKEEIIHLYKKGVHKSKIEKILEKKYKVNWYVITQAIEEYKEEYKILQEKKSSVRSKLLDTFLFTLCC